MPATPPAGNHQHFMIILGGKAKSMRKLSLLTAVVLSLAVCAGCIPESENPISPLAEAAQDTKLYGVWRMEDNEVVRYVHIGAEAERGVPRSVEPQRGLMRLWIVTHRKDDDRTSLEKPVSMRFFVSQAGANHYMNTLTPFEETANDADEKPPKYFFIKYEVAGSQLTLCGMDLQGTAAAIDDGELGGTVVREGRDLKSVQLTDSSEHLLAYLSGERAKKLFPEKATVTLRRVP